jgi:hypothetical protein
MKYSFIFIAGALVATHAMAMPSKVKASDPAEDCSVAYNIMQQSQGLEGSMDDLSGSQAWVEKATSDSPDSGYGESPPQILADVINQAKELDVSKSITGNWLSNTAEYNIKPEEGCPACPVCCETEPCAPSPSNSITETKRQLVKGQQTSTKPHAPIRKPHTKRPHKFIKPLKITKPAASKPKTTQPKATKPKISRPKTTKLEIVKPKITKVKTTKPKSTKGKVPVKFGKKPSKTSSRVKPGQEPKKHKYIWIPSDTAATADLLLAEPQKDGNQKEIGSSGYRKPSKLESSYY